MIKYFHIEDFNYPDGFKEELLYSNLLKRLSVSFLIIKGVPTTIAGGNKKVISLYTTQLKDSEIRLEGNTEDINLFEIYLRYKNDFKKNNNNRMINDKLKPMIRKDGLGNIEEFIK